MPCTPDPRGIGGWLLLLCALLIVWGPIQLSLVLSSAIASLPTRGTPLGILIIVRLAVTAFGLASGLALLSARDIAVTMARIALVATAVTDTFVDLTSYFPSNRMPGDDWCYVAASLAYSGGWLCYLARSRRVRNTFD